MLSEQNEIQCGIRQGFVLSSLLFNLLVEENLNEVLNETSRNIKVNGIPINNIRCADYTSTQLLRSSGIVYKDQ